MPVSMSLGILIGLITALICLLVIRYKKDVKILFSIPVCWALGFIGDGALLNFVDFNEIIGEYFTFLLGSFGLIILYPTIILILRVAKEL